MKITDQQKSDAILHATVWEGAGLQLGDYARRHPAMEGLEGLQAFAMIVAGNYRKVVNTGEVEP